MAQADRSDLIPAQVRRLLEIGGVKHVDLYAGRNFKQAPKIRPLPHPAEKRA